MASNKIRVGVINIQAIALSDNPLNFFTALFIYENKKYRWAEMNSRP